MDSRFEYTMSMIVGARRCVTRWSRAEHFIIAHCRATSRTTAFHCVGKLSQIFVTDMLIRNFECLVSFPVLYYF